MLLTRPALSRLLLPARVAVAKSADFAPLDSAAVGCATGDGVRIIAATTARRLPTDARAALFRRGGFCISVFRFGLFWFGLLWFGLLSVLLRNECAAATPSMGNPLPGLSLFQSEVSESNRADPLSQPADSKVPEVLFLKNGDRLTGFSLSVGDRHLHFELPYGSVMRVPIADIDHLELAPRPLTPPPTSPIAPLVAPLDDPPAATAEISAEKASETGTFPENSPGTFTGNSTAPATAVAAPLPSFNNADLAAAAEEVDLQNRKLFNTQHKWNPHVVFDRFTDLTFATMQSWTRRISVGGKYLEGNSRQQGVDLGLDFEQIRERTNTQINFTGQYAQANRARVANRWTINSNTDLKFDNTKWIVFTKIMDEYDELQRLDYRGVYSAGIGYHWLDKPDRRLITRIGPAATVEVFQRPSIQRFTADMFAEVELRCPVGERVQFEHKTSVHPTLTNFELVRLLTNSSLNYSLDDSKQWSLRIGVQYIYISLPNAGRLPYDVSTNLSIVYQRK